MFSFTVTVSDFDLRKTPPTVVEFVMFYVEKVSDFELQRSGSLRNLFSVLSVMLKAYIDNILHFVVFTIQKAYFLPLK